MDTARHQPSDKDQIMNFISLTEKENVRAFKRKPKPTAEKTLHADNSVDIAGAIAEEMKRDEKIKEMRKKISEGQLPVPPLPEHARGAGDYIRGQKKAAQIIERLTNEALAEHDAEQAGLNQEKKAA